MMINKNKSIWSKEAKALTKELHKELSLNQQNWHKLRGNKKRRVAELIIGALSQTLNEGEDEDIRNLLKNAIDWLDGQIKDPGCEHH